MSVTPAQANFLTRLRLPVPDNPRAASLLLDFALRGNNSRGETGKDRRALIRQYWQRWVGKIVQIIQPGHPFRGACGRVQYLKARTPIESAIIINTRGARRPLPFTAIVHLPTTTATLLLEIHLTGLKLARHQALQTRLFV